MNFVKDYVQDLRTEFKGYNGKRFGSDVMAGITVAAVALPLALAFGVSSGATAAAGLVTAIIGGVIISLFSGASFQISGPTGAMSAILVTLAAKYGMQGILMACFMAGVLLLIAGVLKVGRVIYYIPSSVITGFTSGIAITIALGQLDNFFGVTSHGELAIEKVVSYFTHGFHPDFAAMGIGIMVILIMILWPAKLNSKVPSSLAALIIVLIMNSFFQLDVAVVGDIPKSLFLDERLSFGVLKLSEMRELLIPALSIAALAMIESLLCGASAGKMKNEVMNGDRELIAQGIGNILIPIFGGIPATAAIARTSVAIKAGCETRMTGIIHALILLLSMFVLAPIMSGVPLSALAGILIVTAWRMNDWDDIKFIFKNKFKTGMAKFLITMGATVILDLTQAILIGVAFASFMVIVKLTDIEITIADVESDRLEEIGIHMPNVSKTIRMAYLTGSIFFAVTDKLKVQLHALGNTEVLILSMRGVPSIDLSGIQALLELREELEAEGIIVMLTSVQPKVLEDLRRGGLVDAIGEDHIFESAEYAIVHAHKEIEA